MFLRQLVQFAIGAAGLGIASHFIGEAIPVSALRPDHFFRLLRFAGSGAGGYTKK